MGSKTPSSKVKQDNICDVCDSKFQTIQALRTHKNVKHPSQAQQREISPAESSQKTMPKNTSAAAKMSRASKRLLQKKSSAKDTEESENSEDQNKDENVNKIEFSCPRCDKMFPIYFQALKHIQKKHCEDGEGKLVSPDSPDIIKPVAIETCIYCKKLVSSSHNCNSINDVTLDAFKNSLYCLGCDEKFLSVALFNKHACYTHNGEVDHMFFKTNEEFTMWKQIMEAQVKIKYLALNRTSTYKYFQCNYVSPKNEFDKTYLCPSLLVTKEYDRGMQIQYNKEHFGHITPTYQIPAEFYHYLTNKVEEKTKFDSLIVKEDDDLYLKFRDLLANISNDAAKVNISHLKKLFQSALEMQGLLNSYDEEQDDKDVPLISKSMTDDQITNALESKRSSARLKRKSETRLSVDFKKIKDEVDADVNVNPKSKKDENKTVSKENKEFESPKLKTRSSPSVSPSFNDTYKQFIGEPKEDTKRTKNTKRKEIVKTKMGQFSPKKKASNDDTAERKPNILKPSKTNTSFVKDIKYEVREQENDCNILILKI